MVEKFLPTISSLVALGELGAEPMAWEGLNSDSARETDHQNQAERAEMEWQGAITSLGHLLKETLPHGAEKSTKSKKSAKPRQSNRQTPAGILLSGPFPVLDAPKLTVQLSNWVFIPPPLDQLSQAFSQLMPADDTPPVNTAAARILPLIDGDPLAGERFCLLLTERFSVVLVLGRDADNDLRFQFSFTPEVINQVWRLLRSRIYLTTPKQLAFLNPLVEKFVPTEPDYRIVSQFSRWMLSSLPVPKPNPVIERIVAVPGEPGNSHESHGLDTELLQAMAHEIRTPLTTIRTLTRSLIRRKDLVEKAKQRLQQIDNACTQQIDRFNLIFKAVELEAATHKSHRSSLTATALSEIIQSAIPQWEQAATRRNLSLEVKLPKDLPMVASDPILLQQVLTGLVELFTHTVAPKGQIQLHVMAAGDQLKLEFQAEVSSICDKNRPTLKSLGKLLMFQPDTGGLSLNLQTTKALFTALGAKLTVRERTNQGVTWMVFLPIETAHYPIV
ncbi:sensor histidine kinase [Leptolyngbyaceae cyanobacterium CCMR0082]|uniref:histidine kinase n=2 Tax=Adonisia turfae TaxID=2950184 RepID=A0A6M0SAF4_9CYAN|nr:HAMP domain-containing sensor histidine kinase [Adonisia turfae]MDV3350725.1 HAMP domain-containing sensor histidine kinase [Leptothoe sp. LEGE 181152]NEZ61080.1 sensor histidine kinase [Adonisia turfae CCMR0081]NEZ65475.1 sensor histidine kinase [Adonisia turfae CCMR0082]